MSNDAERASRSKRGLIAILAATAISGGAGYVLQILVPLWLDSPAEYLQFGVFWATTFLFVSMVSGFQQEVARAVHPLDPTDMTSESVSTARSSRVLVATGLVAIVGVGLLVFLVTLLGGSRLFYFAPVSLGVALALALVGYLVIAIISGIFYGIEAYNFAAGTTVLDALLRFVAVLVPVTLGLGLIPAAYGIAVPFIVASAVMWILVRKRIRGRYYVDVNASRLLRNGSQTMLATLATGILISGLPALLSLTSSGLGDKVLAGLVLALILTRAPLVIPLLAVQSYLVVSYRKLAERAWIRAIYVSIGVVGFTVLFSSAAWLLGPWFLKAVYGEAFVLNGADLALIVASGGATAGLCVITPALLARGLHSRYLASWAISVAGTAVALLLTSESLTATITAIALGPIAGYISAFAMLRFAEASD